MADATTFEHLDDDERDALEDSVGARIKFYEGQATLTDGGIRRLTQLRQLRGQLKPELVTVRKSDLEWLLGERGMGNYGRIKALPGNLQERINRMAEAVGFDVGGTR